jgi:ATP-binding cassette, subfamily B, bacterial
LLATLAETFQQLTPVFGNSGKALSSGTPPRRPAFSRLFREDFPLVTLLLILMGGSTLLGLLQAWPLAVLVDSAVGSPAEKNWMRQVFSIAFPNAPLTQIVALAVTALVLRLLQEFVGTARRLVDLKVQYNGLMRTRCDLYRKLQAMHIAYYRSQPLGDSLFRLTTDTFGCHAVLSVMVNIAFAVVALSVISALLMAKGVGLSLLALSVAPPLLWVNVKFGRRLREKTVVAKESNSDFTTTLQRSMSAIVLTQAFGREDEEFRRFGATVRKCVRHWFGIHRQELAYRLSVGAIFGVGGALLLTYGGILVYERRLSPGELMIFMTYLGMLYDPLCQITGAAMNLQNGLAGARRVFEILDRDVVVSDDSKAVSLAVQPRTLTLENVGFEYRPGEPVLEGISVVIKPGQSVAFVGSSGVGKSTLLNLLPRFYDPTAGKIKLDEWDIRHVQLRDVRRHIALTLQESVILPTTVAENIAYGFPAATGAQIAEAARLAGANVFIEALPQGYFTQLSDGGQNLSGGQRQRIALARSLLTGAPILVLDEPTSALDSHHEQVIQESLRSLKGKCTIVLVSHRIGTVMDCDLIYVLDGGRVVEQGPHSELIRLGGIYASMAKEQLWLNSPIFPEAA